MYTADERVAGIVATVPAQAGCGVVALGLPRSPARSNRSPADVRPPAPPKPDFANAKSTAHCARQPDHQWTPRDISSFLGLMIAIFREKALERWREAEPRAYRPLDTSDLDTADLGPWFDSGPVKEAYTRTIKRVEEAAPSCSVTFPSGMTPHANPRSIREAGRRDGRFDGPTRRPPSRPRLPPPWPAQVARCTLPAEPKLEAPPLPAPASPSGTKADDEAPAMMGATEGTTLQPDITEKVRLAHPKARCVIALVEYMRNRDTAPFLDIACEVHNDEDTSQNAIRTNIKRVNEILDELQLPVRYETGGEYVIKRCDPL